MVILKTRLDLALVTKDASQPPIRQAISGSDNKAQGRLDDLLLPRAIPSLLYQSSHPPNSSGRRTEEVTRNLRWKSLPTRAEAMALIGPS